MSNRHDIGTLATPLPAPEIRAERGSVELTRQVSSDRSRSSDFAHPVLMIVRNCSLILGSTPPRCPPAGHDRLPRSNLAGMVTFISDRRLGWGLRRGGKD
jgi:hypothetical protein